MRRVFSSSCHPWRSDYRERRSLPKCYLHMGLAYLQLADKTKARMAFEQAAASNADPRIKEQAAYNYALCIHETSYSAFGESVTVFEKFLNEFPNSPYAEKVSNYLVEVYMNTRSYDAALKSIDVSPIPAKPFWKPNKRSFSNSGPSLLPTRSSNKPSVTQPKRHVGAIQPPDQGRRPLLARRVLLPPEPDERSCLQFQRISVTHPAEGYGDVRPCLL